MSNVRSAKHAFEAVTNLLGQIHGCSVNTEAIVEAFNNQPGLVALYGEAVARREEDDDGRPFDLISVGPDQVFQRQVEVIDREELINA